MTDTLPYADPFGYISPDNAPHDIHVALVDGEFLFVFSDLAEALLHDAPAKMVPTCDAAHVRRVKFYNLRNERKCVTLDGLFTATPHSRTDSGEEGATGPAVHFHAWLREVVIPQLDASDWPATATRSARLRAAHERAQAARLLESAEKWQAFADEYSYQVTAATPRRYDNENWDSSENIDRALGIKRN